MYKRQELRLLAQAGGSDLFVQVGGKLTIERWKDNTDATELIIPDEMVISAKRADLKTSTITIIEARGASISKLDCGEQILSSNQTQGRELPASTNKCVISGIETPTIDILFNNLRGSQEDFKSARISSDQVNFGNKENITDGGFSTTIRREDGMSFGPQATIFETLVRGPLRSNNQESNQSRKNQTNYSYTSCLLYTSPSPRD